MKIRVISAHSLGGGIDCAVGEILDVSPKEAARKVYQGFAVFVEEKAEAPGSEGGKPEGDHPEGGKPEEIHNRDPKPGKGGKRP